MQSFLGFNKNNLLSLVSQGTGAGRTVVGTGLLLLLACFIVGCGGSGSEEKPESSNPATQANSASPQAETASSTTNQAAESKSSQSSTTSGRKYVDGIPYDVFYDQPLSVAAENTAPAFTSPMQQPAVTMGGSPMNNSPANPTAAPATPTPPSASADSGATDDWNKIISKELLTGEVMRLRNSLSANLNSVGSFNRELLAIQADASVLAALAGIAAMHEGDFTWKPNAKFIRDFSYTIAMAAESRGRPAFETAEKPFLNIVEILDGGTPAELPESEEQTVFSDIAERNLLMKQVKVNADWLLTTVSSEAEMKSKKEELIAKATILATIGTVIKQEDYVFADEDEYQDYCKELIEGSLKMVEAAQADNFTAYKEGLDLMNKSCSDCHPKYLNN